MNWYLNVNKIPIQIQCLTISNATWATVMCCAEVNVTIASGTVRPLQLKNLFWQIRFSRARRGHFKRFKSCNHDSFYCLLGARKQIYTTITTAVSLILQWWSIRGLLCRINFQAWYSYNRVTTSKSSTSGTSCVRWWDMGEMTTL